ncbi:hypothetical protein F5X97DRAFT_294598 [Nemania serpens]|nr:hypothetical protein F5X97DRAFT_294598 [Nemania serpens]
MNRKEQNTLMDRHNKIMAAILTRFRNMVIAATEPIPTAGAIPYASLNVMTMNNETSALVKEIENLLALTREIKKLWVAGPLRKPGDAAQQTRNRELEERAQKVTDLYNTLEGLQIKNENKQRKARLGPIGGSSKGGKKVENAKSGSSGGGGTHIKRENTGDSV